MPETPHFSNEGFGWTCKRCRRDEDPHSASLSPDADARDSRLPRFFREGEAEEREPRLAQPALARWRETADGRRLLFCPSCGAEEELKS